MKYYYKGKPLINQFSRIRYIRITKVIKKGMNIDDAIKYTEQDHRWTPSKYKFNGKTCFKICKEIGLNYSTFLKRLKKGWSMENSLKIRKTKKQIEWEKTYEQQRTRL